MYTGKLHFKMLYAYQNVVCISKCCMHFKMLYAFQNVVCISKKAPMEECLKNEYRNVDGYNTVTCVTCPVNTLLHFKTLYAHNQVMLLISDLRLCEF